MAKKKLYQKKKNKPCTFIPQNLLRYKKQQLGFPGGPAFENPPANAGDIGSIHMLKFHMPQSNEARASQLLSLCSKAHEPQLLSPCTAMNEA